MECAQIPFALLSPPPSRNYRHVGRFAKDNWNHFVPAKKKKARAGSKLKTKN